MTLIEIDGFKTFQDFKLELSPFQVIVGPNGAGKSNLFDALHLLSRLADTDLRSAFQELRGDAIEVFMTIPNGKPVNKMRLAVEMLVDRSIQDSWGARADLKYTRMRYELEILRRNDEQGLERLYVLWAAFCAATVEELCVRTSFPCPVWTNQPDYFLEQSWFYYPQPSQRDWLLSTTPEPFKRRNIFIGGSVLDNKYELQFLFDSKPKWAIWSDQELQDL